MKKHIVFGWDEVEEKFYFRITEPKVYIEPDEVEDFVDVLRHYASLPPERNV